MAREVVQFLLSNLVFVFMLATGLEADVREETSSWRRRGIGLFAGRSLLVMALGIPLLALAVVKTVPMPGEVMALILLIAACPGKPFFLSSVRRVGASVPASINLLMLVALAAPLTAPFWVMVFGKIHGLELSLRPGVVFDLVTKEVVLPLALGFALNHHLPRLAKVLGPWVRYAATAAFFAATAVVVYFGILAVGDLFPGGIMAMILIVVGSVAMGHWAGGRRPEDRRAVGLAAVSGDPTLVMAIVAQNFPDARIQAPLAACLVVRALLLIPYQRWLRSTASYSGGIHAPRLSRHFPARARKIHARPRAT